MENKSNNTLFTIGWFMIIMACIFWLVIVVVPFLSLSVSAKATTITVLLILGEVFFWIGAIFVGKEVVTKYRSKLNPKNWFKKDIKKSEERE